MKEKLVKTSNSLKILWELLKAKSTWLKKENCIDNKVTRFNKQITSNKAKHLEIQKKRNSLITRDYSFFLGRIHFTSDVFVYQPTLDALELKKGKDIDYYFSWESKVVYNSNLKPLYTTFLHNIKHSEYRIGIKLIKDPLAVEQNNYLSKIVNIYTVSDLDTWPKNPTNNFKFKNCFLK